ncbi:MAG TPA: 4Fe-4S dicluster domain-containing protein [candidate division Zixibacteria bacterium]|nr:4Fe-4S dicluster domain-containing protein [candidate division Zixibacteria bacterium]HEQ99375.1 4Fe-4S dicluster domain-containing protein [candidate division Zixibacteria bacterium]
MTDKKKRYWSTLEEYYHDPEVKRLRREEFFNKPEKAFKQDFGPQGFSRRDFMKLGGAAAIFSMIACGNRPVEKIVPYVSQPEEITLGIPNYYASTCTACPAACGLVVKTREGRPIKMEGNPEHPVNKGRLCARGQASLLDLYDPGRLRNPVKIVADGSREKIEFADADQDIVGRLKNAEGQVVLLTGAYHGPAKLDLVNKFLNIFDNGRHYKYEALFDDGYARSRQQGFGSNKLPQYHLDNADVVVLLGSDLFASGRDRVRHMRDFAEKRKIKDNHMSRVYAFEPAMSEMGSNADERYPVKMSDLPVLAGALMLQLIYMDKRVPGLAQRISADIVRKFDPYEIEEKLGLPMGTIKKISDDLWNNRGRSIILSESFADQGQNSQALHQLVHVLNSLLDNESGTIETDSIPDSHILSGYGDLRQLVNDMNSGRVSAILIAGTNPLYSLPDDFGFAEALKHVPLRISLDDRINETAELCEYVLPGLHGAECWGDSEPYTGLYAIQQPTITPLWNNRQLEDSLIAFGFGLGVQDFSSAEAPIKFYDYVKKYWQNNIYRDAGLAGDFQSFWVKVLQHGFFESKSYKTGGLGATELGIEPVAALGRVNGLSNGPELILSASSIHIDGRSMNNAWLLETPDPVSRIAWDNYLAIAPSRAHEMGLKEGDVVTLTINGKSLDVPVHLAPGTHKDSAVIMVGWGRTSVGDVGNKAGVNAFKLAKSIDSDIHYTLTGVELTKSGKRIPLASVQGHNYIEHRPILYETTLEEYREDPTAGRHQGHGSQQTLWKKDHRYPGHKWGMVIDLNSCIGCNACMTACQVENNIPVVGKNEVLNGREMHWIRVDRYYSGEENNPDTIHQPMLCHHCDDAPCETVCPVLATVHNDEGLNLQIYNRCVGTRYCSNNCPYKVRRFNYYDYYESAYKEKPLHMLLNPDVTVRSKGVMEKCTFCIQRIRDARHQAKSRGQPIGPDEVQTACQQTCPAGAISFGDLNQKDSLVSKESHQPRAFKALVELNIDPNVSYLTLVRNKDAKKDKHEDEEH